MASGLLSITGVTGTSPNYQLTVTSIGTCAAGDHVIVPLTGLPVGRGGQYRVALVPDLVHINIVDDIEPSGGLYGQPGNGNGQYFTPTVNYKLTQMPNNGPYWGIGNRRDEYVIDDRLQNLQTQITAVAGAIKSYATELLLLADAPADSTIGYAIDTDNFWWRRGGVWEPATSELQELATHEALTFPVDYNDPTAVDPTGMVFSRQADIAAFLAGHGTTHFKTFQAAWYSAPSIIRHNLTFTFAAGVQRPRNPEPNSYAFVLDQKLMMSNVFVYLNGAAPSQYRIDVASASITSVSGIAGNPYVDFAGTPFTGKDLRGYHVVFDTGQAAIIHKNTNNRLYLCVDPSPTPTSGFVGRPSTILRNSYNDVAFVKGTGLYVNVGEGMGPPTISINDLVVDGFACSWDMMHLRGRVVGTRVLFDHAYWIDEFHISVGSGQRPYQSGTIGTDQLLASWTHCSIRGCGVAAIPTTATDVYYAQQTYSRFYNTYFGGAYGVYVAGQNGVFIAARTVIDAMRHSGITAANGALVQNQDRLSFYSGKYTTFRNCTRGIQLEGRSRILTVAYMGWRFEGTTGPCIELQEMGSILQDEWAGYDSVLEVGDAPNSNVGIDIIGPHALVYLPPSVSVSGAVGEVRMNGILMTHADITANGPYVDLDGNRVSHG